MKKICKDCNLEKDIKEFYKHPQTKDGYLNKCKDCVRQRVKNHRDKNIDRIREYDRARGQTEKRKAKVKSRNKIYNGVRDGLRKGNIVKSKCCEDCGSSEFKLEGHHFDYSKPLEVVWLCKKCHMKRHSKYDEEVNKKELI